ncbi:histidine ammonia-lyase [Nitrospina watsonii]|uniref:Histidine ammonia-lyase n=1 Tax=Nitrospina watsonii TaxID=1323948 RepID=A0ABN8VW55_9BACT|nr:histidine ammonia-lyase [Nitrospina watsonii]CAI2717420.1 Histidine ammonia-lyase [Nitrospina watsonii]
MKLLELDGNNLTLEQAVRAIRDNIPVGLTREARKRVQHSRTQIDAAVRDRKMIYGVTTGFGALSNVVVSQEDARRLQTNVLMSHAAGVGIPFEEEVVRMTMLLMANSKAKGYSGLRLETVNTLLAMLNQGVVPVVPQQGSVGASGDLAPMAHLSLVLIGRGKATYQGEVLDGAEALRRAGIEPVTLAEGEGLALINGTQVMTALGALTLCRGLKLAKIVDIAAAMSLEVLLGTNTQFHKRIHHIRPHPGQIDTASNMRKITDGSEIISSHKDCDQIQDAYSLRCVPQVHGATRDTLNHVRRVLETEMNSATENPLVFENGQVLSGGNFHGQPVALVMDFMTIALAELANISERRIERMVNPNLSGLPSFLIEGGGLNSGFMIAQYTAAALVSENKAWAHPASVDSIPTSANKEDHVSMGTIGARKAAHVAGNVKHVAAIELLCGAQAMDLFTNLKPGQGTLAAYERLRQQVTHMDTDRELHPDIETVARLIDNDEILDAVEKVTGPLL